jgi:hypothetical protein
MRRKKMKEKKILFSLLRADLMTRELKEIHRKKIPYYSKLNIILNSKWIPPPYGFSPT